MRGAVAEVLGEAGPDPAARPEVPERFAATLRFLSGAPMAPPETPNLVVGMALATLAADCGYTLEEATLIPAAEAAQAP